MNQIYPTDLTDAEWSLLSPFFFPEQPVLRAGPKETPERTRRTLNALRYLNKTGCQWRMLPTEFPPRSTVHDAFTRWSASGLWPRINTALREKVRLTLKKPRKKPGNLRGNFRWSGYAEAMAGKARSRRGLVRIIGQMAWPRESAAGAKQWGAEAFPAMVERRALVFYRAILGGQGAERKREDGTVVRRGLSERVREKLTTPNERRLAAEVLTRRVRHFTRGVIIGSRAMIDGWFASNREVVQGRSRTERKGGAKSMGRPALRGLYALRDVR